MKNKYGKIKRIHQKQAISYKQGSPLLKQQNIFTIESVHEEDGIHPRGNSI
jgi:hypothetical protein